MKIINANYAHQTTRLTKYDLERYDRQMRINGFGSEGQRS
jgi:hypothetical protein